MSETNRCEIHDMLGWSILSWSINPKISARLLLCDFVTNTPNKYPTGAVAVIARAPQRFVVSIHSELHFPQITMVDICSTGNDQIKCCLGLRGGGRIEFDCSGLNVVEW